MESGLPLHRPMLPALVAGQPLTMSSREIAELVEVRHDNVKRTIDTLVKRGVIELPQTEEDQIETSHGRKHSVEVYRLEKRDSFVVVAQLSPEFTGRIVDRWQELEEVAARAPAPVLPDFTNPVAAARAWADEAEGRLIEAAGRAAAEALVQEMAPTVAAHERLTKADGSLNITEAAKSLGQRPKDLFDWLSHNGWIYRRAGSSVWLGYQTKCNQGLVEHKTTTVLRADGSEKITEQVRITAKGMSALARLIQPVARLVR